MSACCACVMQINCLLISYRFHYLHIICFDSVLRIAKLSLIKTFILKVGSGVIFSTLVLSFFYPSAEVDLDVTFVSLISTYACFVIVWMKSRYTDDCLITNIGYSRLYINRLLVYLMRITLS